MSSLRVQEGEDSDAISPVARPSSIRRGTGRSSARNSLNMTWPLRPSLDDHRTANANNTSALGAIQTIVPITTVGAGTTYATNTSLQQQQSSQQNQTQPQPESELVEAPRKKGVSFFFAEEDPAEDEVDEDGYDEAEARAAIDAEAEAEADYEVMRNIENLQLGLNNLDQHELQSDTEDDPVEVFYDNDGEKDTQSESNRDQERLDRFMQPTSNSDEGVLELNRERIDWQSMLQSVLTGEVFSIENKRLEDPNFEIQPAIKHQIWLGLRATIHARPATDEERFVETARTQVDSYLQEVMDFKVDANSEGSPLEQVLSVLLKVDMVESLYPKNAAIGVDKPLYGTVEFQYRLSALNAYASVMKKMKIQTKILRNWTGSETLEVTRSKDSSQEVSFVDRLLKENGLERTFEKSTLSSLREALIQIKATMVANAVAFASMGLVPTMNELQRLVRFPSTLMQECLRLRLEYADRVTVPTLPNVDQMLEDFKTSLFLACQIKYDYEVLEGTEDGWYLEPCIDSEYEKVLKLSLQFYFKLLSWKVEYWGQSKKATDSVLDLEWESLSSLGQQIDGIGLDTAEQLCFLTSKSTTFLYKHLQEQMKERPELPQTAGEVTKVYGKVLENVRFRANRLRRFTRTLTDTFENTAEYLLDKKKGDTLAALMTRLAETNHVMIYTNNVENLGTYIIVEHKVAESAMYLSHTLRSCFEQAGTGYILVFTPRDKFFWGGHILHLDSFPGIDLDLKPGRVRLISERGSLLDSCKKRFSKFADPYGLEIITESRANVTALNKELNKTKKAAYKLADTIVQSVTVLRKITMRVPNCQDLVQPFFRFASDYGLTSLSSMEGLPRSQFNLKLLRLSIDWVSFVCDDCDQTDRQTFRWAMSALNFAMKMTKGNNILALSDSEFSWLRNKIAGCMTLLISHFDIHGARTQSEILRNERDGRQKQKPKDQTRLLEEIAKIFKLATANESGLSEDAARNHRVQIEKLCTLEKVRTEREQDIKVVGKVLDDQKPEDRSLVFLAALSDSVAIRWQMAKYIGSGTFGTVYLGTNSDTGELIAVKEIRFQNASMSLVKSIHDEMKVMKMLHHPNIVRYDNIEVHRHKVFIFMEFCQGGSLADLLEHGRIEDEKVIKFYTLQMLKGLAYLHGENVVHRDVKPDNVLLDHLGNIKFVDFGAAKILAKNQRTRTHGRGGAGTMSVGVGANSLNGTPMYMAPEVIKNGEKGRKGSMDIWSLGCCVLEMATGRRPWAHLDNEWAVMYHVATSHPPLPDPAQMSPKGISFLKRCFTRSAHDRPSATELLRDVWLRGVETEENMDKYAYDESAVEMMQNNNNSDEETSTIATPGSHYGDHDEFSAAYAVSSTSTAVSYRAEDENMDEIVRNGDGESSSGPGHDAKKKEEADVDSKTTTEDVTTLVNGTTTAVAENAAVDSSRIEVPSRSATLSPLSGIDSNLSDNVSEVGSEVELMLSAVREREETSRQASMQSSPIPGQATTYPWHTDTSSIASGDDGSQHGFQYVGGSINGSMNHQSLPSLSSVLASASATASVSLDASQIAEIEEQGGFARQMGLDSYDSFGGPAEREERTLMSPVLSMRMMDGSGGDGENQGNTDSVNAATAAVNTEGAVGGDIPLFAMMTRQDSDGSSSITDSLQDAPLFP
ncbi:Suppressor of Sensor Kinase (SLN1) [Linnemannia gamsii]|uniref:Suppressor of Sensor Kinase (SLN1) n=1 Tax=Linnemannia gamsii TaxID=64522 RepID=A0ABQ7JZB3_9FUNG|nr:Suppressor of Sensor Kinase (SLN1) [Linnemannia gamsii]